MQEKVWFALVGIKPLEGNELTPDVTGAYVRVACKLADNDLETYLKEIFNYHRYSIFDISEIRSEDQLNEVDISDIIIHQLFVALNSDAKFAWGTFHTWT